MRAVLLLTSFITALAKRVAKLGPNFYIVTNLNCRSKVISHYPASRQVSLIKHYGY